MKKNLSLILICFALTLGFIGGFLIEGNTHFWEGLNKSRDLQIARNDSSSSNWLPDFKRVEIKSPMDGTMQKAYFYSTSSTIPQPLVINLHSWSWDYRQYDTLSALSKAKNINYIHPDFRGQNWNQDACCSDLVLSDIDASIDYAIAHSNVDTSRLYVIGRSGGGYATLATFMKSKHKIKKFSSWVPLTDLIAWYDETRIRKLYYSDNILLCTHSTDRKLNEQIAKQKSPLYWQTPVDKISYSSVSIFTGVYDGIEGNGPIPITQSINFYNKLLADLKVSDSSNYISNSEKLQLLEHRKPLGNYGQIGGRKICLVKEWHHIKIILFIGGHEMLSEFAFDDLLKE